VFGSFLYQGQICMSTERFVVDDKVAGEFVAKFAARAKGLAAGDPLADPACIVGPMMRPESGPRINGLIDDAVSKGAEIVVGGHADGAAMPATIVDKVRSHMAIYDQETFGPITTVVRVSGILVSTVWFGPVRLGGMTVRMTTKQAARVPYGPHGCAQGRKGSQACRTGERERHGSLVDPPDERPAHASRCPRGHLCE
jgi:hypothetical protein